MKTTCIAFLTALLAASLAVAAPLPGIRNSDYLAEAPVPDRAGTASKN